MYNSVQGEVQGPVVQIRDLYLTVGLPVSETADRADVHPWSRQVGASKVWEQIKAGYSHQRMRELAMGVAQGLAVFCEEVERGLASDPWLDRTLVERFGKQVDWLVSRDPSEKNRLYPAEAVLLSLAPLLHQCLWSRAAYMYSKEVDPTNLRPTGSSNNRRSEYEDFLRDQDKLVVRANLELEDRDSARTEISWWLFHRWLVQRPEVLKVKAVAELLTGVDDPELSRVLHADRVRMLLYGLRVDPRRLTSERQDFRPPPVDLPFRGPMVALLLGLAHVAAIEVTDLSDVLVWHMGIPRPATVEGTFASVRTAEWTRRDDGPVLTTRCDHEAVVEVLREHASRFDALLRDVRLKSNVLDLEPLRAMPLRASGDGVEPEVDEDGKPLFSGWSKFQLDEERVRDLLMGEQLYQDRHMAVRELYQNALDACRYRQARETYNEQRTRKPSTWVGKIQFRQGVERGRHFIECEDNGIGMDTPELTGVFAQAGVRFANLPEYREEQLDWESADRPVKLFLNSRFGIGVLSYFMLADEIEVTTRRMGRDGLPDRPAHRVTISGPGHLFRIKTSDVRPEPGTTVRLYLREPDPEGKAIRWLDDVLVIADFSTTAEHEGQSWRWLPGVLGRDGTRERTSNVPDRGRTCSALDGQVFWCEFGGGLLVDGLVVKPSKIRGVIGRTPGSSSSAIIGAVVNLVGHRAPKLSVDRTSILDDVANDAEELLVGALAQLLAEGMHLVGLNWLNRIARSSLRLADLITVALIDGGVTLDGGSRPVDVGATGWLTSDPELIRFNSRDDFFGDVQGMSPAEKSSDHILLWRLVAHAPNSRLDLIVDAVPGLVLPSVVLPAIPSDIIFVSEDGGGISPGAYFELAQLASIGIEDAFSRGVELVLMNSIPSQSIVVDNEVGRILLSVDLDGEEPWLDRGVKIAALRLFDAHVRTGIPILDIAEWMAGLGFDTSSALLFSSCPDPVDLELVRDRSVLDWSAGMAAPRVGHLLDVSRQLEISLEVLCRRLDELEIDTSAMCFPSVLRSADVDLLMWGDRRAGLWLRPDRVYPGRMIRLAESLRISLRDVAARFREFGLMVPDCLPDAIVAGDVSLVEGTWSDVEDWGDHGRQVPIGHLLASAKSLDISLGEAIDRIRDYGLQTADLPFVPEGGPDDLIVLSQDLDGESPWLVSGQVVPVRHLTGLFAKHRIRPEEAAARLVAYGYSVAGVPVSSSLNRLDRSFLDSINLTQPICLRDLMVVSADTDLPLVEAAQLLRDVGLDVPDVVESIRSAVQKIPRRSTSTDTHARADWTPHTGAEPRPSR
ncbi:hypothetical protein ACFFQW_21100 [Umezawaea endophytica]|uniref:Histidine kinase/DNA gyrase B/HSP90-like ATPase n=1 Tax=Umezawaea endophytica TaxID=1654476 RepID=A0A9X3AH57_9PSEU|nr:hypothetical protein [Umezawaea endophytica]MCS7480556.1 hypothetical protein [Umezawaea endophytica]